MSENETEQAAPVEEQAAAPAEPHKYDAEANAKLTWATYDIILQARELCDPEEYKQVVVRALALRDVLAVEDFFDHIREPIADGSLAKALDDNAKTLWGFASYCRTALQPHCQKMIDRRKAKMN